MRYAILSLVALMATSLAAQAQFVPLSDAQKVAAPLPTVDMTGEEIIPYQPLTGQHVGDIDHLQIRDLVIERQVIGLTQYDLQSNYAVDDRMVSSPGGISAGWIQSLETSPFSDRGTGYNYKAPGPDMDWGEIPYDRIEDVRIGWPSLGHLANGFEFALSHGSTGGLVFATRDAVDPVRGRRPRCRPSSMPMATTSGTCGRALPWAVRTATPSTPFASPRRKAMEVSCSTARTAP